MDYFIFFIFAGDTKYAWFFYLFNSLLIYRISFFLYFLLFQEWATTLGGVIGLPIWKGENALLPNCLLPHAPKHKAWDVQVSNCNDGFQKKHYVLAFVHGSMGEYNILRTVKVHQRGLNHLMDRYHTITNQRVTWCLTKGIWVNTYKSMEGITINTYTIYKNG